MPAMREIGKELGLKDPFELNSPVHLRYSTDLKEDAPSRGVVAREEWVGGCRDWTNRSFEVIEFARDGGVGAVIRRFGICVSGELWQGVAGHWRWAPPLSKLPASRAMGFEPSRFRRGFSTPSRRCSC